MHIDGKMITRLNPTNPVSKTKKLSNQASEQSGANIGQASDFALNQSGLDQTLRQTNDQLTQLLSRQNALEKSVEKLNGVNTETHDKNVLSEATSEIREPGLFVGTNFEQHLNKLLASEKPLVESINQTIRAELKELSTGISEKVKQTQNETPDAGHLIQRFQDSLNENPQALHLAHSTINPQIVHGLLGSASS